MAKRGPKRQQNPPNRKRIVESWAGFYAEADQLLAKLEGTPDIVAVALVVSQIDDCLLFMLRGHLREGGQTEMLLGENGPISGLGNRARLAYSLWLIDNDQRQQIEAMATIRNRFVHSRRLLSFDSKVIAELITDVLPEEMTGGYTVPEPPKPESEWVRSSLRELFVARAIVLAKRLAVNRWSVSGPPQPGIQVDRGDDIDLDYDSGSDRPK